MMKLYNTSYHPTAAGRRGGGASDCRGGINQKQVTEINNRLSLKETEGKVSASCCSGAFVGRFPVLSNLSSKFTAFLCENFTLIIKL